MPNETEHIQQANRNDAALKHLMGDVQSYSEWVTTVAFYKAVHVIEAMLFHLHGKNSHDHKSRLDTLRACNKTLYREFRPLYVASMVARYLCDNSGNGKAVTYATFSDYLPSSDVVTEIVNGRLVRIEQIALNYLSKDARSNLTKTFVPHPKETPSSSAGDSDSSAST